MDIVERLKEHATGYEEWRVVNPEDGSYVISFSWIESCRPEHEAREWLTDHLSRNPDSWVKGYEVRNVMVQGERDLMLLAAADEITRLRSDLVLAQGQRDASEREVKECDALRSKLADILTRTANALKGEPGPLQSHSWHDLPERVTAAMNALAGAMALASANVQHDSDCAMHNAPAYPNGPCDCTRSHLGDMRKDAERLDWMSSCEAWIGWTRDNELCRAFRRDEDGDVYPVCGWDKFFDTARDAVDAAMQKGE